LLLLDSRSTVKISWTCYPLPSRSWQDLRGATSVFDQLSIHEVDSLDSIEPDANLLVQPFAELEDDQECDEAAGPNLLINDTELTQLQGRVANQAAENVEQPPLEPRRPQDAHQLSMPTIRRSPLNEFNKSQPLCPLHVLGCTRCSTPGTWPISLIRDSVPSLTRTTLNTP
jgi:hypothetical protein